MGVFVLKPRDEAMPVVRMSMGWTLALTLTLRDAEVAHWCLRPAVVAIDCRHTYTPCPRRKSQAAPQRARHALMVTKICHYVYTQGVSSRHA